jgi:hypothetical protein
VSLHDVLARAGELTPLELVEVLSVDQHVRWQAADRVPVEQYLQHYTALVQEPAAACELVYGEFLLRQQREEAPDFREYLQRFPQLAERICLKALAAEPEQRYASARELAAALHHYLRRRLLAAVVAGALLVTAAVLGLALGHPRQTNTSSPPLFGDVPPPPPLSGDLRAWVDGPDKNDLEISKDLDALPVRNGETVHLKFRLNQPAYVYLLWLDSLGKVSALYPWNEDKIDVDVTEAPPDRPPQQEIDSPSSRRRGWEMAGAKGLETILLLARRTPLPEDVPLPQVIGRMPPAPFLRPNQWALRGSDDQQPIGLIDLGGDRGPEHEAKEIDNPIRQLEDRLQKHFELIRVLRFAHVEK